MLLIFFHFRFILKSIFSLVFCRSEHYNNLHKQEEEQKLNNSRPLNQTAKPLKDNSNIQLNGQVANNHHQNQHQHQQNRQEDTKNNTNALVSGSSDNNTTSSNNNLQKGERPLKCLETLAQKAGITFDEKYDTFVTLEKSQSPAQVQAPQTVPLQISQEHLQQLQHYQQIQQAFVNSGNAIQVKQEFGSQQQNTGNTMQADIKQQMDASQAAQQQMQQQMQVLEGAPGSPHQSPSTNNMNQQNTQQATQINTMQQLQAMPTNQLPAEWAQRVQLLPSPIQNSGYLQGLYTTPQVLMGSNLIPSGLGQQQIQVITAGKPFPGGQLGQQMLATTSQGKQVIGSSAGSFGNTYAMPSSQAQTLLFSPVSVISSQPQQQQTNILTAAMAAAPNNKQQTQQDVKSLTSQKILQKVAAATTANGQQNVNNGNGSSQTAGQQCVQVSQGTIPQAQIISPLQQPGAQQMQFTTPWNIQGMPQFWTTNGLQSQVLASNPIIFRGTQADGTQGMFIQHNPQTQQTIQTQQHNRK